MSSSHDDIGPREELTWFHDTNSGECYQQHICPQTRSQVIAHRSHQLLLETLRVPSTVLGLIPAQPHLLLKQT